MCSASTAASRKTRALTTTATELGLHLYTGLLSRPYVLGNVSVRRGSALQVFEALKAEYDDLDDSDIPKWRRVEIPALTQQALTASKGDPKALANEVMRVRSQVAGFRSAITSGALALRSAKTRAEKRKVRQDTDAALASLLEKEGKITRLSHEFWEVVKNPFAAHIKVGDKLVEKDQLNQAIDKVVGLSDLWALVSTAPAMERNASPSSRRVQDAVRPEEVGGRAKRGTGPRARDESRCEADLARRPPQIRAGRRVAEPGCRTCGRLYEPANW